MVRMIGALARPWAAALGILTVLAVAGSSGGAADATTGALALTLSAAVLALALILAVALPAGEHAPLTRPRAQIDVSALVAQSHPDAAGHARPRAPGSAATAA